MEETPMLRLQVVCYSKSKTVADLKARLKAYPQQQCNTKEAFDGLVAEFSLAGTTRPVGSLPEYHEAYKATEAVINCSDGQLSVKRQDNGDWIAQ